MSQIFLTARKVPHEGATNLLTTPKVIRVEEDGAEIIAKFTAAGAEDGSVFKSGVLGGRGARKEFWVAETPQQIEVSKNPSAANLQAQDKELSISALGTTQGAGAPVTKYFSEVDDIANGATEAATLDAATVGKTRVVLNNDAAVADILKLFPASGENFSGKADDAVQDVKSLGRIHLYCNVAGTWIICSGTAF